MTQRQAQSPLAAGFANQVKLRRRALGLSARELAERCAAAGYPSLKREAISNIEVGRRQDVTLDEAACLAYVLGQLEESRGWTFPDASGTVPASSKARVTYLDWMVKNSVPMPRQIGDPARAWLADEFSWLRIEPSDSAIQQQLEGLIEHLVDVKRAMYGDGRGSGVMLFDPDDPRDPLEQVREEQVAKQAGEESDDGEHPKTA